MVNVTKACCSRTFDTFCQTGSGQSNCQICRIIFQVSFTLVELLVSVENYWKPLKIPKNHWKKKKRCPEFFHWDDNIAIESPVEHPNELQRHLKSFQFSFDKKITSINKKITFSLHSKGNTAPKEKISWKCCDSGHYSPEYRCWLST